VAIGLAILHLWVFPPDGFYSGDQGPKYLQAAAFAEQGPLAPDIAVLSRDLDTRLEFQDPILRENHGRLVAAFNWLLPIVTAPFLSLMGMRGLYVIPALSTVVIFVAARHLGRALGLGDGTLSAWTAVVATPVLFYAAEVWEHAPAAAGVLTGAALITGEGEKGRRSTGEGEKGRQFWCWFSGSGAAIAGAALFREEAFAALPALLVARAIAGERAPSLARAGLLMSIGAATVFVASVPMSLALHGSPLPLHLTNEIAKSDVAVRGQAIRGMLLPSQAAGFYVAAVALVVATLVAARRADAGLRLALAHIAVAALLLIPFGIPAVRWLVGGQRQLAGILMGGAPTTWVFALALVYVPLLPGSPLRPFVARVLVASALLMIAMTIAVAPSAGGAQWSPRYLLCAAPLLAVVAPAPIWTARQLAPAVASQVRALVSVLLVLSALVQCGGLLVLAVAKMRSAAVIASTAAHVEPGGVVISVVAWFPEIAAPLLRSRRIMFAHAAEQVTEIAARAATGGWRALAIVTHPDVPYAVPSAIAPPGACRFLPAEPPVPLGRDLVLQRYRCE
jgi:hypothetical protein